MKQHYLFTVVLSFFTSFVVLAQGGQYVRATNAQTTSQTFCGSATVADLQASGSVQWFSSASGGTALSSSTVLTTGTYYVEETMPLSVENLGSGFSNPFGVAIESNGKILIADTENNVIRRMNADGTGVANVNFSFTNPTGVAVQPDGNILIADFGNNAIKRMNWNGTGLGILKSANQPRGVAVKPNGHIIYAETGSSKVMSIDSNGNGTTQLGGTNFSSPFSIAIQPDGKILVADTGNNAIKRMNADGTGVTTLASGLNQPRGVAVKSDGTIYFTDTNNNLIKRMNTDGSNVVTVGAPISSPTGIAIQPDGKIVVANFSTNKIIRITEAKKLSRVAVSVTVASPPPAISMEPISSPVCTNDIILLKPKTSVLLDENFNNPTNNWTVINNSIGTNYLDRTWQLGASPQSYTTAFNKTVYSNDNSQMYIVRGVIQLLTDSALISPSFSTTGLGEASLSFWHHLDNETGYVSYSIDNGNSWTVMQTLNKSFIFESINTLKELTISLPTEALNQSNVKIKLHFIVENKCFWIVDNIKLTAKAQVAWSPTTDLYKDAAATIPYMANTYTSQIYAKPTTSGNKTYNARVFTNLGCTPTTASVTMNVNLPPIAPIANNQTFCGTKTIENLIALGANLKWYNSSTGGTALAISNELTTRTYYVSQTVNACESERTAVAVTVIKTPTPVALAQTLCIGTTVADLAASGTAIKWYTAISGGTVLATPTILTSGNYFVSQTVNGCESVRKMVTVTINPNPIITLSSVTSQVCANDIIPLTATLNTSDFIVFHDNFNEANNSWTAINNSTGGTPANAAWTLRPNGYNFGANIFFYSPSATKIYMAHSSSQGTDSSTDVALISTEFSTLGLSSVNLSLTHQYAQPYLKYSEARVQFSVNNGVDWTTIIKFDKHIQTFTTNNVNLPSSAINQPHVKIRFQYNASNGIWWVIDEVTISGKAAVRWSPATHLYTNAAATTAYTLGTHASTVYVKATTAGNNIYTVKASTSATCSTSGTTTVNVIATPSATAASNQTFCGSATVENLTASGTNLKWYDVATGGTHLTAVTGLTTKTYYVSQTVNGCESTRKAVEVTVNTANAQTSSVQTLCSGSTVANLVATGTAIKWYSNLTDGMALSSTTPLTTKTYYVTQTINSCESIRKPVSVIVNTMPIITSTVGQTQTCKSSISAVDISGGLSGVRYIRIKQNLTAAQDGSLHLAELQAFEIFTATEIAQGKTVTASGAHYSPNELTYQLSNMTDGDPNTIYHSASQGDDEWVEVDLGAAYNLDYIKIFRRNNSNIERHRDLQLIFKNEAGTEIHSKKIDISGGSSSITYNILDVAWTDGATRLNRTGLNDGTYTLNYADVLECTATHTKTVNGGGSKAQTATAQTFCGSTKVSNLFASGTNLKWYDVATNGTPLDAYTALATGRYYVSQTVNGCESDRTMVAVTVNAIPETPTVTNQIFCGSATMANLQATGINLKWYNIATGGTALTTSTNLTSGNYYVSQTVGGCESLRKTIIVTVNAIPAAPTASNQIFSGSSTVANLQATGIALKWYASANGGTVLNNSTALTSGNYYISQTINGCESERTKVVVVENIVATHLNFDGINDYVEIPNEAHFDFTNQMTVEFWMNSNAIPQQWDALITKGDATWSVTLTAEGKINFAGTGSFGNVTSNSVVTDGTWKHIAVTYNGNYAIIYIDGLEDNRLAGTGNIVNSSDKVSIGENLQTIGRHYEGNIDEVRFWNLARTESQITANINCELQGTETGLVAYYKFNQGMNSGINTAISTVTDATANGNNGNLNGFTLTNTTSNFLSGSPITTGMSCATLSISSFNSNNNIILYPVPTDGLVTVIINDLTDVSVMIYDLNGRLLLSKKINEENNLIDIFNLQSGVYLFKIKSQEGETIKKVLKN
ncbi:streptogramin lyase [Flavobacterium sp. PL11]|uniref:Ig-like domain-containing protein n=1 Tax=Flavobacterium sp. PL11 TaxID=3071717 RepID=UPI002DFE8B1E|nr:streptogramin lyase [Flavobacterium sp. PL11]